MEKVIYMDYIFGSILELKAYVKPALDTKVSELNRHNITYVKQDDIFEYLRNFVWPTKTNLSLYNIVDDILNTDNNIFSDYVLKRKENSK